MTSRMWGKAAIALAIMVMGFSGLAFAQAANSSIQIVTLSAHLNESISVNINSGTDIDFTLAANTAANAGSTGSSITTSWVLKPSRASVAVWAYFGSATAALNGITVGNTVAIPPSAVKIQVGGAGAFNPMTAVNPFNGLASGLQISSTAITGANKNSNHTDTLAYQIDTTVVPQLPADDYTGIMNIQAQAN